MGRVGILSVVETTGTVVGTTRGEGHKINTVVGRVRILPGVKATKLIR